MLNKSYDNLYTIEILCHGIPSEDVWICYKKYLCDKYNSKIKFISFRDKKYGWHSYSIKVVFDNGKKYIKTVDNDMYMQSYLRGYNISEICYSCPYKEKHRVGDITLGDLWGVNIKQFKNEIEEGISLMSLNSKKGEMLFSQVKDYCDAIEINDLQMKNVISNMTNCAENVSKEKKKKFFELIKQDNFLGAYKIVIKGSILSEIKRKIKSPVKIMLFKIRKLKIL